MATLNYKFIIAKPSNYDEMMMKFKQAEMSRKISQKLNPVTSRDLKRAFGLAATHPALYQCPTNERKQAVPSTSTLYDHPLKKENLHPVSIRQLGESPLLPWQTYVDPKRQTSQTPAFDDPKLRMLRSDINVEQARVISPVLMIGLPCGDMIEAAHVYQNHTGQPTDAPSS